MIRASFLLSIWIREDDSQSIGWGLTKRWTLQYSEIVRVFYSSTLKSASTVYNMRFCCIHWEATYVEYGKEKSSKLLLSNSSYILSKKGRHCACSAGHRYYILAFILYCVNDIHVGSFYKHINFIFMLL